MKQLISISFLILVFISCGTYDREESPMTAEEEIEFEQSQIKSFFGEYLMVEKNKESGLMEFHENCWTKQVDGFELSEFAGSPNEYYFAFHGHHSIMYLVDSIWKIDFRSIGFTGRLEDESSDEIFHFNFTEEGDGYFILTENKSTTYTMTHKEYKEELDYFPCEEEAETLSELDHMNEIFKAFFNLQEGGDKLASYIPENGLEIITPGSGVSPILETATNSNKITATNLFNTPTYERLLEYIQMHNNEERVFLEFVKELPDRCAPGKEALFVKTTPIDERPIIGTAMLTKMNDEQEEVYTYIVINFEYANSMKITKIDATECGL